MRLRIAAWAPSDSATRWLLRAVAICWFALSLSLVPWLLPWRAFTPLSVETGSMLPPLLAIVAVGLSSALRFIELYVLVIALPAAIGLFFMREWGRVLLLFTSVLLPAWLVVDYICDWLILAAIISASNVRFREMGIELPPSSVWPSFTEIGIFMLWNVMPFIASWLVLRARGAAAATAA